MGVHCWRTHFGWHLHDCQWIGWKIIIYCVLFEFTRSQIVHSRENALRRPKASCCCRTSIASWTGCARLASSRYVLRNFYTSSQVLWSSGTTRNSSNIPQCLKTEETWNEEAQPYPIIRREWCNRFVISSWHAELAEENVAGRKAEKITHERSWSSCGQFLISRRHAMFTLDSSVCASRPAQRAKSKCPC